MSNKVKDTDEIMIDAGYVPVSGEQIEEESTGIKKLTDEEETVKPKFRPATINELNNGAPQVRKIPVPPNRFTPLKKRMEKDL
ncbi:11276_t:CDS:2 [Funneliformis mosseae]|uniref:11276_t:CDS:1 n=1 Tax=Funneliformis mosseae TaxID=27381 RepID=A0A9N8W1E8_FUNMO|nr:11276_t:CDS:2 [Funneliformis mosseae]